MINLSTVKRVLIYQKQQPGLPQNISTQTLATEWVKQVVKLVYTHLQHLKEHQGVPLEVYLSLSRLKQRYLVRFDINTSYMYFK